MTMTKQVVHYCKKKKWIFYEEIAKIYWPKSYNLTGNTQTNPPHITKLQYSAVVN